MAESEFVDPSDVLRQQLDAVGVRAEFVDYGDIAEALKLSFPSGKAFLIHGAGQWVGSATVEVDEVAAMREP